MIQNPHFMVLKEVCEKLVKHGASERVASRMQYYFLSLRTPSGSYLYSKAYFNAFIVYLESEKPTPKLAAAFQSSKKGKELAASEKAVLPMRLNNLKKRGGLSCVALANFFCTSIDNIKRWELRGYIIELCDKPGFYDSKTLLKNFEWSL